MEDCLDNLSHPSCGKGCHLLVCSVSSSSCPSLCRSPVLSKVLQCGFSFVLHFCQGFPKMEGAMCSRPFSEGGALRLGRTSEAMTRNSLIH